MAYAFEGFAFLDFTCKDEQKSVYEFVHEERYSGCGVFIGLRVRFHRRQIDFFLMIL